MTTEIFNSTDLKNAETKSNSFLRQQALLTTDMDTDKLLYLWKDGKRVIGSAGLQIFENCNSLENVSVIKEEQKKSLERIINSELEKLGDPQISNHWRQLIATAKDFFNRQGYCVISKEKKEQKTFNSADLWNVYRRKKARLQRRFI